MILRICICVFVYLEQKCVMSVTLTCASPNWRVFIFCRRAIFPCENMALNTSKMLASSFEAAKILVKSGSLTADEKILFASFSQEIFDHKDLSVRHC